MLQGFEMNKPFNKIHLHTERVHPNIRTIKLLVGSLLAEVSRDEAKLRERREEASEAGRGLSPFSHFCLVVRDLC